MKLWLCVVTAVVASTAFAGSPESRDPFQPPHDVIVDDRGECLPGSAGAEYCGIALDDLKVVAAVYGAHPFVMLESPDAYGHVAKIGAHLPQNRVIDAVTSHSVWLRAEYRAPNGDVKSVRYEVEVGQSLK